MKTKWQLSIAIALILLFVSSVISCSTPAPIPEPPKLEEGWIRLIIQDVGSIDYPTNFLELQSEDYGDFVKEFRQVLELGKSDFTLQQVGLNEIKPSTFEEYRRVLLETEYLKLGEEVFRANEKYTMSQKELTEFHNEWMEQLRLELVEQKSILGDNRIVDLGSLEIVEINRMYPLVSTFKRQQGDNPVVLVKRYMFFNYDKIHYLTFSYRVEDEEQCRDIYEKILNSFRLN